MRLESTIYRPALYLIPVFIIICMPSLKPNKLAQLFELFTCKVTLMIRPSKCRRNVENTIIFCNINFTACLTAVHILVFSAIKVSPSLSPLFSPLKAIQDFKSLPLS